MNLSTLIVCSLAKANRYGLVGASCFLLRKLVGETGFEHATSRAQGERSSQTELHSDSLVPMVRFELTKSAF
jgi:hypothetical protein